jgi:hypothetical protein
VYGTTFTVLPDAAKACPVEFRSVNFAELEGVNGTL